jgi:uridine phosphorylase
MSQDLASNPLLQAHIRCSSKDAADYAILPGDPARVERVGRFLEKCQEVAYNREFRTVSGYYKGTKLLVTSTGIGGPSTGIAVEELRNIGVKTLIRIGSCGALQKNIRLGDLIIATGSVRNEGTSDTYIEKGYPAVPDIEVLSHIIAAAKRLGYNYHCGIVRSHDSFYTDQEAAIDQYWGERGVLGADMESAPLMVIGGLRKLKTASILNAVVEADGQLEEGINNYVDAKNAAAMGEEREITLALEAIASLSKCTSMRT